MYRCTGIYRFAHFCERLVKAMWRTSLPIYLLANFSSVRCKKTSIRVQPGCLSDQEMQKSKRWKGDIVKTISRIWFSFSYSRRSMTGIAGPTHAQISSSEQTGLLLHYFIHVLASSVVFVFQSDYSSPKQGQTGRGYWIGILDLGFIPNWSVPPSHLRGVSSPRKGRNSHSKFHYPSKPFLHSSSWRNCLSSASKLFPVDADRFVHPWEGRLEVYRAPIRKM